MGKYIRKAKVAGDILVMEVSGVRTRARTLALQKLQNTATSTSYLQLRSRRLDKPLIVASTDGKKPKDSFQHNPTPNSRLESVSLKSGSVGSVSLSSSKKNGEAESQKENEGSAETSFEENVLENEGRDRDERETTPSNLIRHSEALGTPGSTTRPATNRRIRNTMTRIIPSAQEMEEFFVGAEQQQQRIFTEKYNFDPISDSPLPGRYVWVRMDQ